MKESIKLFSEKVGLTIYVRGEKLLKLFKSTITLLIVFGLLFYSPFINDVTASNDSDKKDINIINRSNLYFDEEILERKNIIGDKTKVIQLDEKQKEKNNVLLYDKNNKEFHLNREELAKEYYLVAAIDNSDPKVTLVDWIASPRIGPKLSGTISVVVDLNGYLEEGVDISQYDEDLIRKQTIIDAINDTLDYVYR